MALRKWNKQRKVIFPLLHSLPKQQMWGPLKSHFIFTQPKDHFCFEFPYCLVALWIHTQQASYPWEGSSFCMKHDKKTYSESEKLQLSRPLDSFWVHTMGLARANLRAGSKGHLPSGFYWKDWHSPVFLAAFPQGRCPGSLQGKAGSWAPRVGSAYSQARASKTGGQSSPAPGLLQEQ